MKKYIPLTLGLIAWGALSAVIQIQARNLFGDSIPTMAHALLFGAISGGGGVLIICLLSRRRHCPKCRTALPRFRKPSSLKQAAGGGWDCPTYHAQLDRTGAIMK